MSKHLENGDLRAYLDGELPEELLTTVSSHLESCPECQAALQAITLRAERADSALNALSPGSNDTPISPQAAFLRLQTQNTPQTKEVQTMWQKLTRRSLRPLWAGAAVVVMLALLMFIPQVRAAAINFLGLFRVESIQVVQFNPANLPQNLDQGMVRFDEMMNEQFKFEESGEPVVVGSAEEASQLAGFTVKQPAASTVAQEITYQPGSSLEFTIDVGLMQLVLEELGSDLVLPKAINGEKVSVEIPASVTIQMGDCRPFDPDVQSERNLAFCTALFQGPSPTVSAPPGVDVQEVGEAMLQLLGMSATEAANFSANIDWATTLVLPVPQELSPRQVTVNGVPATLLVEDRSYMQDKRYTLIWIQDGILYGLTGRGSTTEALRLAESLQ